MDKVNNDGHGKQIFLNGASLQAVEAGQVVPNAVNRSFVVPSLSLLNGARAKSVLALNVSLIDGSAGSVLALR